MLTKLIPALLLASALGAQSAAGQAPIYKLLYSPSSGVPGANPTTMFEVEPGLFYVLSSLEDNTTGASIFAITSTGTFKLIYSFQPYVLSTTLVHGTNGKLCGPGFLAQNSYSFYFSLDLSGKNVQEYPFPGKVGSAWETTVAPPGELYDIVGVNPPQGSRVFGFARIDNSGKIIILHQFSGSDGTPTGSNLVYGPDGNFYSIGADTSTGFIFRFTPSGAYSKLLNFPSFPANAPPPLIAASDGNLYGLFDQGGANNTGEIYQATLSGQLETVASFPAKGMVQPWTLMQASDGNLYGTTISEYIFRYNLATHELAGVYHLNSLGSQGRCPCKLIQGMDGKLYGVTPVGGNSPGIGAVFSLDIGLPKPTPLVSRMEPASGPVGQRVLLWGQYLLGATSVEFNGVTATSFTVSSGQSAYATVPPQATTGPVTITTANGFFTTTENFTVQ